MSSAQKIKKGYYFGIGIFVLIFLFYILFFIWQVYKKTPYFTVIINPAHGGKFAVASKNDGDLYDPVNKKYTLNYQAGYSFNKISEYRILLNLSKRIEKRLRQTKAIWNWGKFKKILLKYGCSMDYKRIILAPELTKEYDYQYYLKKEKKDINRYFRLFDYPSKNIFKKWDKGILSFINKYKPEIVLNIDFNYSSKADKELFSINVPNILFFNYIRKKLINKNLNFNDYQHIINYWYGRNKKEKIKNLIKDTWIYFTGTYPGKTFFSPSDKFAGLGYNCIKWSYNDKDYPDSYKDKKKNPQYYPDLKDFKLKGAFWKREQYNSEKYKRLQGDYGVGDNEYISEEILKYIISILNINKDKDSVKLKKRPPVYKYDVTSLYVNSLVININLGSMMDTHIQNIYKHRLDEVADAICIGIYSICQGYDLKKDDKALELKPRGKAVNFKKYYKCRYIGRQRRSYRGQP